MTPPKSLTRSQMSMTNLLSMTKYQLVIDPSVVTDTTQLVNDKSLPIGRNLRPCKYFFDQYPTSFLKLILNQCLFPLRSISGYRKAPRMPYCQCLTIRIALIRHLISEATDLPPPNVGDQGEFLISCQLNLVFIFWKLVIIEFYNLAAHLMLSHSAGDIPAIRPQLRPV